MRCFIHKDRKPGQVLRFNDGSLKFVRRDGSVINAIRTEDGRVFREPKLNKKQRRRQRAASVATA